MGRSGMIRAYGQPEIAGPFILLAKQPCRRIGVDAAVPKQGFRGYAHGGQFIDVNGVDLKAAQVPGAVGAAQSFSHAPSLRGEQTEKRGRRHSAYTGGIQNTARGQRSCHRNDDFGPLGGEGHAGRQTKDAQKQAERSHFNFSLSFTT